MCIRDSPQIGDGLHRGQADIRGLVGDADALEGVHQVAHGGDVVKEDDRPAEGDHRARHPQAVEDALHRHVDVAPAKEDGGAFGEHGAHQKEDGPHQQKDLVEHLEKGAELAGDGRQDEIARHHGVADPPVGEDEANGRHHRAEVELVEGIDVHQPVPVELGVFKGIGKIQIQTDPLLCVKIWGCLGKRRCV